MSKFYKILIIALLFGIKAKSQGIHFSQYYNAPHLLNPANTALIPEEDFSIGVNYREQWTSVPAPFKTFAAHADMQFLRNKNITNWLGLGIGFFSDKAGDGILSLDKIQASLAYHIQMGESSMLSAGLSVAYAHRTIDFSRLTFDMQWDGYRFSKNNSQSEPYARQSLGYLDMMLGVNYAYFPNEDFYMKIGAGLMHLNSPNASFYKQDYRLGIRPMANIDVLFKAGNGFIVNPSLYYTNQKKASELVFGTLFYTGINQSETSANSLIYGVYYRMGESFIPVVGLEWNRFKMMFSYDITASPLAEANRSKGAAELGVIFKGFYGNLSKGRDNYSCPRI